MALVVMAFGGAGLSPIIAAQEIEQAITAIDAAESGLQARPPANERDPSEPLAEPTEAVANPEPAEEQADNTEKTEAAIPASPYAVQIADWVVATGDSHGKPFIVIDKVTAEVLAYNAEGQLQGVTPALLGIAHGDDSTPGIGQRELSQMGPAERTTPAGRFVAQLGRAAGNQRVLWVDFATSVALHPVVTGNKKERRLQRLQSPTPDDNRITFGCINVPAPFFRDVVRPLFADSIGVVYIIPETKYLIEVFPAFEVRQQEAALSGVSP